MSVQVESERVVRFGNLASPCRVEKMSIDTAIASFESDDLVKTASHIGDSYFAYMIQSAAHISGKSEEEIRAGYTAEKISEFKARCIESFFGEGRLDKELARRAEHLGELRRLKGEGVEVVEYNDMPAVY